MIEHMLRIHFLLHQDGAWREESRGPVALEEEEARSDCMPKRYEQLIQGSEEGRKEEEEEEEEDETGEERMSVKQYS